MLMKIGFEQNKFSDCSGKSGCMLREINIFIMLTERTHWNYNLVGNDCGFFKKNIIEIPASGGHGRC